MSKVDLTCKIGDLEFKNPILVASGTFGYGLESSDFVDINKLGGIVTKSLSLKPRKGNPPPRIVETAAGMLNAIGLANIGVEKFIKEKLPLLKKYNTNIIINIAASSVEEYIECVKCFSNESVHGFEINISCPNVHDGGLEFGTNLTKVGEITSKVVALTAKPVIIKLTPNVTKIWEFAEVAKKEGASAVSAINTFVGMAIDIKSKKTKLYHNTGGLSGPAIKPLAVAKVFQIKKNVDIPIIGIGGITNYGDVIEFILAGATCVQIGTHNFVNPKCLEEIIDGLEKYCLTNNIEKLSSLIGKVDLYK